MLLFPVNTHCSVSLISAVYLRWLVLRSAAVAKHRDVAHQEHLLMRTYQTKVVLPIHVRAFLFIFQVLASVPHPRSLKCLLCNAGAVSAKGKLVSSIGIQGKPL